MDEVFQREDRYIVIKRKHLSEEVEQQLLVWLNMADIRQVPKAVVVEGDWPEYEPVWAMIEARVTGTAHRTQQAASPDTELLREARQYVEGSRGRIVLCARNEANDAELREWSSCLAYDLNLALTRIDAAIRKEPEATLNTKGKA